MEDTHLQLKKNVYQNYGQFIDTAKEISFLESEMYQLAHMITEQRNLLHELMDASVLGDKVKINIIKKTCSLRSLRNFLKRIENILFLAICK